MKFSAPNPPVQATTSSISRSVASTVPTASPSTVAPVIVAATNPVPVQQPLRANLQAYGHFPYAQANPIDLTIVSSYATGKEQRFEALNLKAGRALMQMIYAAREEGVWIVPVSGFRTIEQQQKL